MREQKHDTHSFTPSMDELIIKTVGFIETLPERLSKIEDSLIKLDKAFSNHESLQEQDDKQKSEQLKNVDSSIQELLDITKKLKEENQFIKNQILPLSQDLENRNETKQSLYEYLREAFLSFIRYAMVPFTVIILCLIGFDETYIPWYRVKKEPSNVEKTSDIIDLLWTQYKNGRIPEYNVTCLMRQYPHLTIVSYKKSEKEAIRIYEEVIEETDLKNKMHIFIWLPQDSQNGYLQLYDKLGHRIGTQIQIDRR